MNIYLNNTLDRRQFSDYTVGMRILVLDDDAYRHKAFVENNPADTIDSVYTWQDAVTKASENKYDFICIDHDLGFDRNNGYLTSLPFVRVLRQMIEEGKINYDTKMIVHSSNPVGAQDILSYFSRAPVHAYKIPLAWAVDFLFDNLSVDYTAD
jgi:hypothetical protein